LEAKGVVWQRLPILLNSGESYSPFHTASLSSISGKALPSVCLSNIVTLLQAALEAGEVVWQRGLLRRRALCHGVSGNAYVFLALYKLTGDVKHLQRAQAFGRFLLERADALIEGGEMHGGDHPWSLFEGLAGTACLYLDLADPENATFPGYGV
jgi:hypothetical protein